MLVECIQNNDLEQMVQLWNQRRAHAVVGVSVIKNREGKTMLQGLCLKKYLQYINGEKWPTYQEMVS